VISKLEHEAFAYWEVSSAAAMFSREPDARRAREAIEDLHMHALYGTTARLRASAEGAIRAIAASPFSAKSVRRAAKIALTDLARQIGRANLYPDAS
jgi:hypothetical protein